MPSFDRLWNIFARELQQALAAHGCPLSLIDNRTSIHPEKVRRLQRSLHEAKHFPTLNPDDLAEVVAAFHLSTEEALRLRAAVVATAVEAMLMGRINQYEAWQAADRIFEIVLHALHEPVPELIGVREGGATMSDTEHLDAALEAALTWIDHATLALHLSRDTNQADERVSQLRQAYAGFGAALRELQELAGSVRATAAWASWYEEATRGLAFATRDLRDAGA